MSHLDPDRLALIATGADATPEELAHLATCDRCSVELAEFEYTVVVGRSTVGLGELEAPPERVWTRIAEELELSAASAATAAPAPSAAHAAPKAEAPAPKAHAEAPVRPRRGIRLLFALAASVAAVLAVVGVWSLVRPAEPLELASATLDAFPAHPEAVGSAVVVESEDGERQLKVELEDADADDGFREVWLITADASALVSLGVLDGAAGTFDIPDDVDLRDYVLVDISQEPEDGDPAHSGDSIVRGELDFV